VIEDRVRGLIPQPRFLHSRNVALLSSDLCHRYRLAAEAGYLAGITHDMCKALSSGEMLALAQQDGGGIDEMEQQNPALLHGRAAAIQIQTMFGVRDRQVIEAVRLHTTGGAGMGDLAKIVYIADKIEARRNTVEKRLRHMAKTASLDTLFPAIVAGTVAWLEERNLAVSGETLRLLNGMNKNEKNKN
jgi:nicotinate-nucleotide adenylyltransferase